MLDAGLINALAFVQSILIWLGRNFWLINRGYERGNLPHPPHSTFPHFTLCPICAADPNEPSSVNT